MVRRPPTGNAADPVQNPGQILRNHPHKSLNFFITGRNDNPHDSWESNGEKVILWRSVIENLSHFMLKGHDGTVVLDFRAASSVFLVSLPTLFWQPLSLFLRSNIVNHVCLPANQMGMTS